MDKGLLFAQRYERNFVTPHKWVRSEITIFFSREMSNISARNN